MAAGLLLIGASANAKETAIDIAPVWSGHPVGFSLLTHGDRQYVAFYDANRKLTVASRSLSESKWHFVVLPQTLGWDSHNYITMAMDDAGCIHLCANMHAVPLVYFRTAKPGDIDSFEQIDSMIGRNEKKCTYPAFLRGPGGEFIFTYRDGGSGNGDQYYNVYDTKTKSWRRLMDSPLTSGEGLMNAYFAPLRLGPDGYYHLVWIWRNTPDCSTNHDISYARSKDLIHWETHDGRELKLPITLHEADIVDPVPVKSGAINGSVSIGFDSQKRPIVSYIKFDEKGYTQVYDARLEQGQWKIYKISSWDYRWDFGGGGTIIGEVGVGSVGMNGQGRLTQNYRHVKYGSGTWILDEATLKPVQDIRQSAAAPEPKTESSNELQQRTCGDSGSSGEKGVRYVLKWETLAANRDHPHKGQIPSPSMLRLVRIEQ